MHERLRRHLNGDLQTMKDAFASIRVRYGGKCFSCGIDVISKSGSGWKQESINDMHPERRIESKAAPLEHLVTSCLACNLFQNKLSWDESRDALSCIATGREPICDYTIFSRVVNGGGEGTTQDTCPTKIRKQVLARDNNKCVVTGLGVTYATNKWNTASYDRIDSKLEYTLENTRVVCKHVNFVKQHAITESELNAWLTHIKEHFA